MKRYSHVVLSLLLIVMSIALISCGDKNNNSNKEDNISEGNISQAEPTYGGSVVVGIQQDIDSLDPHKAVAAGTSELLFNIYEGLVKPDKDGNLVPAVASDYKLSEDGKVYTFTLREGIKFHNGNPVTVEDIVYSVKRSAGLLDKVDKAIVVQTALQNISSVKALDDKTIEVTLKTSDTELLGYMTFAIIPEGYEEIATKPVGTGPFKFVSYTAGRNLVIENNKDYWGNKAYLDKVEFKIVEKSETAMAELQAGTIDMYPYLTIDQAQQLKTNFNIQIGNMNLIQGLFLNNAVKPFDDERVRQALCYAIDRQAILDMVAGGEGTVIGSGMFAGFKKYFDDSLTNYYPVDLNKAKSLLAEAGYPNGFEFTITVPSNYQYHVDTTQVIVEQLKQVGITAKIKTVEWANWLSEVYSGRNYDATVIGLDANLAASDVFSRYHSTAKNNFINFNNAEFDRIYEKALASTLDTEKVKDYKELQSILTKDAASVYLADPALMVALNKDLAGYTFYPVYVQDMSTIYYTTQQ